MKNRVLSLFFVVFSTAISSGQDFPYGKVAHGDVAMTQYPRDTGAAAVVLKEFGEAYISTGERYNLIFKYHVRIKILNKNGLSQSDIEIPLDKDGSGMRMERILELKASSFNIVNGRIHEEPLADKNIYTEDRHKYLSIKKIAIPSVRVGSVIELSYTLESPFVYNFRTWEFQSSIPKIESEYWARIPAIYQYNITLRGFLKLLKNESSVVKSCLSTGGFSADCSLMKFAMKDVPAFVEEDYMTAKKNFVSSIHFELSEIRYPDGRVDKVTKEWKDAEQELRTDNRFGTQLRRGKEIGEEVRKLIVGETDETEKARKVYNFIKDWYVWNDTYGKYSEHGIKKAFDERKGNVGDINLSLVAALRFAGLDADPVILSTRANGTVVELHPVLSEFNYVIAKVNIGDKIFLADATEKYYPFGLLPERCLNGKGRVVGDGKSYWIDLLPKDVRKTVSVLTLALDREGLMTGTLVTSFMGYEAVSQREEILSFPSADEYIRDLKNSLGGMEITSYELKYVDDINKPLTRRLDIVLRAFEPEVSNFLFSPFFLDKWSENPFKSNERLYPVDFATPLERTTVFNLEYPEQYEVANIPERVGLSLPNSTAKFLFEVESINNKISMNNSLSIKKALFTSTEYHYLKELFNRILQVQSGELIFRKKI